MKNKKKKNPNVSKFLKRITKSVKDSDCKQISVKLSSLGKDNKKHTYLY